MNPLPTTVPELPQHSVNPETIHKLLETIFTHAAELSMTTANDTTINKNCPYNACALDAILTTIQIDSRVVRGSIVRDGHPYPDETEITLDKYIEQTGNGHWWVEAQLTPDTWWTLDLWSIHPDRDNDTLVMAGRPDEYIAGSINPDGMTVFQPHLKHGTKNRY